MLDCAGLLWIVLNCARLCQIWYVAYLGYVLHCATSCYIVLVDDEDDFCTQERLLYIVNSCTLVPIPIRAW